MVNPSNSLDQVALEPTLDPVDPSRDSWQRFGDILVGIGKIGARDLDRAMAAQREMGGSLDRVLVSLGLVSELDASRALAEHLKLPFVTADAFPESLPEPDGLLPDFLKTHHVLPLRVESGQLDVAMAAPQDEFVLKALIELWRPFWVLRLMLGVAAFEVLALWVDFFAPSQQAWPAWTVLVIAVELAAGGVLLWLAVVWGLVQSLKIRLLAMLHVGFVWLGLALLYSAASQALWLATGQPVLGLGALHALSMGFLGSIMVAMVTRVSCGHSGRALVADNPVWAMFWLLQVAVGVRLLAAVQGMPMWLTALAALLWTAIVTAWALRYANWYGRPRIDGKAG